MAAALRRRLGPTVEIETVDGRYGEFRVSIDGEEVLSAGALAFLGVLPTVRAVVQVVEDYQRRGGSAPIVQG